MVRIGMADEEIGYSYYQKYCSIIETRESRRYFRNLPEVTKELFVRMAYQEAGKKMPPLQARNESSDQLLTETVRRQSQTLQASARQVTTKLNLRHTQNEAEVEARAEIKSPNTKPKKKPRRTTDWPDDLRDHRPTKVVAHPRQWTDPTSKFALPKEDSTRPQICLEDRWKPMKITPPWQPKAARQLNKSDKNTLDQNLADSLFDRLSDVDDLNDNDQILKLVDEWHSEVLNSPTKIKSK